MRGRSKALSCKGCGLLYKDFADVWHDGYGYKSSILRQVFQFCAGRPYVTRVFRATITRALIPLAVLKRRHCVVLGATLTITRALIPLAVLKLVYVFNKEGKT